jgi:hypothetical protein
VSHNKGIFMLSLNWNRSGSFVQVAITRPILQGFHHVIKRSGAFTAIIALLFMAPQAGAGEIEPRAYVNTPVGINFLLAGYVYSDGGLLTAASSPIKDAQLKVHSAVIAYARSLDVGENQASSMSFFLILSYQETPGLGGKSGNVMFPGSMTRVSVSR